MTIRIPLPGELKGDTAAYVLSPDKQFARPKLIDPRGPSFTWPLGTEGFDFSGNNTVVISRPPGSNQPIVDVVFRDEQRITLDGVFPGHTSTLHMSALRSVIEVEPPKQGFILFVPYLLTRTQFVTVESYRYAHNQGDFSADIAYTITFVKQGVGDKISQPSLQPGTAQPTTRKPPRGRAQRTFRVDAGHRDIMAISRKVYGTTDKWRTLYSKNVKVFEHMNVPQSKAPHHRLPLGTVVTY